MAKYAFLNFGLKVPFWGEELTKQILMLQFSKRAPITFLSRANSSFKCRKNSPPSHWRKAWSRPNWRSSPPSTNQETLPSRSPDGRTHKHQINKYLSILHYTVHLQVLCQRLPFGPHHLRFFIRVGSMNRHRNQSISQHIAHQSNLRLCRGYIVQMSSCLEACAV